MCVKEMIDPAKREKIDVLAKKAYGLVVADYPSTKDELVVLRQLMLDCDWYGREKFVYRLEAAIRRRLLHIGVTTHDILRGYASVVEGLALFDPSLVLVHRVGRLIRDYVKTRPDTMQTIINFITTERPGENLIPSLRSGSSSSAGSSRRLTLMMMMDDEQLTDVNDEYVIMLEDNAENRWMEWKPDPHDADPRESRLYRESADVFNMLVSVYGSKDLFVKEYQQLLAQRLIANGWEKHFHSEFTYLETMRRRFTSGELNQCEVMLRDIKESEKLSANASAHTPFPISAKVISSFYWPEIPTSSGVENGCSLHPALKQGMDTYERIFKQHKPQRLIQWCPDYGSLVELELELGAVGEEPTSSPTAATSASRKVQLEIPIAEAQLLLLFMEKEQWNIDEMAERTGVDGGGMGGLKQRVDWWCTRGLLINNGLDVTLTECYRLAETEAEVAKFFRQQLEASNQEEAELSDDDEEEEAPIEMQVDELEQYWLYTRNLLLFQSSSEPLTAQRLTQMYKMFSSPGKPVPSLEAVTQFMHRKIKLNLVALEGGVYKPTAELRKL